MIHTKIRDLEHRYESLSRKILHENDAATLEDLQQQRRRVEKELSYLRRQDWEDRERVNFDD